MMEEESAIFNIIKLDRDEKAKILAKVILQLTFDARSKFSDETCDPSIWNEVQGINRVVGYLIKILNHIPMEEEHLLANTLFHIVENSPNIQLKKMMSRF